MNQWEREVYRLQKLVAIKMENHMTAEEATREARTGPEAARREELAPCAAWRSESKL